MRIFAYLIASLAFLSGCGGPPPSDILLEQRFESDRATFEQIRTLICAKNQRQEIMMNPQWARPGVSAQELADYYPLLNTIGARGVLSEGNCSFILPVWNLGRSQIRGYSHGDYFKGDERTMHVESMDMLPQVQGEVVFYLRPLTEDWNVYHVHLN